MRVADQPTQLPTLAEAGIDKNLADRARKLAAVPEAEFEKELSDWRERVQVESVRVTTNLVRAGEREVIAAERSHVAQLAGQFSLIYADPPWRYEHAETDSRKIENQYPTMSLQEICALEVKGLVAPDAVLFLWATSPLLLDTPGPREIIQAWGFDYKTSMVWDKVEHNYGHYVSVRHEFLLIGTRGLSPRSSDADAGQRGDGRAVGVRRRIATMSDRPSAAPPTSAASQGSSPTTSTTPSSADQAFERFLEAGARALNRAAADAKQDPRRQRFRAIGEAVLAKRRQP